MEGTKIASFLVNCKTCENFFHAKISWFTVLKTITGNNMWYEESNTESITETHMCLCWHESGRTQRSRKKFKSQNLALKLSLMPVFSKNESVPGSSQFASKF